MKRFLLSCLPLFCFAVQIPFYFEKNEGQTDGSVKYLARGSGYISYFTPDEMVMALSEVNVRVKFLDASAEATLIGMDDQPGISNYFIGNDPEKWRTNIPHYGRVRYQNLYPGIDAEFYESAEQLEFDLCISAGANPGCVRMQLEGDLSIDDEGHLHMMLGDQEIAMHKPVIYQRVNGEKRLIDGRYVLLAQNEVGFDLGNYDLGKELVIDPIMYIYSTYLGGGGSDAANGIAVDSSGNTYMTGATTSTTFPTTGGAFQTTLTGATRNAFVTKLNPTGTALVYSTFLGGTTGGANDFAKDIAIDSTGQAYVTGNCTSTDFPTMNPYQTYPGGTQAAFLSVLNAAGSALVYSTYFGGTASETSNAVVVNSPTSVYIGGSTTSSGLPTNGYTGPAGYQPTYLGMQAAFLACFNPQQSGVNSLLNFTYLQGTTGPTVIAGHFGLSAQSTGILACGTTNATDFPTTPGVVGPVGNASGAGFVTKLTLNLTALVYSTFLTGTGNATMLQSIAADPNGDAYVTGSTFTTNYPTTAGAFQSTLASGVGSIGAIVTILNPTATALVYSSYFSGTINGTTTAGRAIAIDGNGNAYVFGGTDDATTPVTINALQGTFTGSQDAFLTVFNPSASGINSVTYSSFLGGNNTSQGNALAINATNSGINVYGAGQTSSTTGTFPITAGAFQSSLAGSQNCFITAFNFLTPSPPPSPSPQPTTTAAAAAAATATATQSTNQANQTNYQSINNAQVNVIQSGLLGTGIDPGPPSPVYIINGTIPLTHIVTPACP